MNRYVRSEGVAAIVLRRSGLADTPRWADVSPYCTIRNIGINNDGFTKEGITFPSRHAQLALEQQVCPYCPLPTPLPNQQAARTSSCCMEPHLEPIPPARHLSTCLISHKDPNSCQIVSPSHCYTRSHCFLSSPASPLNNTALCDISC